MRWRPASTGGDDLAVRVPAADRAAARLVADSLGTPLQRLLRSDDLQVLVTRLLQLDPAAADPDDAERLDAVVLDAAAHRRTLLESVARLLITALLVLVVLSAALLAASFAAAQFSVTGSTGGHHRGGGQLSWPPSHAVLAACLGLAGLAWLLGWAAVFLRGRDQLHRAQQAVAIAADLGTDTWPGLPLDPPYLQRSRRSTMPAATLACVAIALAALSVLDARAGAGARVLEMLAALVLCVLGALLWWRGRHLRRADDVAGRTLFVGRPG